jgi:hypothetical protein
MGSLSALIREFAKNTVVALMVSFAAGIITAFIVGPLRSLVISLLGIYDSAVLSHTNNILAMVAGGAIGFALGVPYWRNQMYRAHVVIGSWLVLAALTIAFASVGQDRTIVPSFPVEFGTYCGIVVLLSMLLLGTACGS